MFGQILINVTNKRQVILVSENGLHRFSSVT